MLLLLLRLLREGELEPLRLVWRLAPKTAMPRPGDTLALPASYGVLWLSALAEVRWRVLQGCAAADKDEENGRGAEVVMRRGEGGGEDSPVSP